MTSEGDNPIPVVDFSALSLGVSEDGVCQDVIKGLAHQLCDAFRTVGFVYLKNHGIPETKMLEVQTSARQFFSLPLEVKAEYARSGKGMENNYGWTATEREIVNPQRPGDLKECFDLMPRITQRWPEESVPGFKPIFMEIFQSCSELCNKVHFLMGVGLNLKDPELFRRNHNPSKQGCSTMGRLAYYPVVPESDFKPNQIRCGEHTDYGSITLLFQDDVGGLEVMNRQGEFVSARPIPGTVVVNVADLMQRWTADQLVSTVHRVVTPPTEKGRTQGRVSFVYFAQPDDECLIECVDGSNKYEPIKSGDYLNKRLEDTYAY